MYNEEKADIYVVAYNAEEQEKAAELYVAGIVVAADGTIKTNAPIYLWNQDFTVNNLIPAWGEFAIPPGAQPPPTPTAL